MATSVRIRSVGHGARGNHRDGHRRRSFGSRSLPLSVHLRLERCRVVHDGKLRNVVERPRTSPHEAITWQARPPGVLSWTEELRSVHDCAAVGSVRDLAVLVSEGELELELAAVDLDELRRRCDL